MEQCHACGATLSAETTWCGQCFAPRGRAATTTTGYAPAPLGGAGVMTRPVPAPAALPRTARRSRWRKTQTTFGPVGRVIATVCLVVPFPLFIIAGIVGDLFALGVAAIWAFVIMPWGLRDVWRAGQLTDG
jgi:hypothetical protein